MTNTNGIIKYSEGAMKQIQHFRHRHPLTLLSLDGEDGSPSCYLCQNTVSQGTPCYVCKNCSLYIHKSCAELPQQLQHPFHPKHPLTLMYDDSLHDKSCGCCGRNPLKFADKYNCSRCDNFHLCINCASLSQTTKVDIHDHPLTLMRKSTQYTCDHCEKEGKGMLYFCATCSFMVHTECTVSPLVERPLIIEAKIHQDHPLTLARKLHSFTCDACGKVGRGMFYICAECSFVVHLQCASLPLDVKIIRHEHPLSLNISSNLPEPTINPWGLHGVCQLCVNKVDTDYMFYYCSTCDFAAHLHCATSKDERDEENGIDESIDMLTYVVKKCKLGVDGIEIAAEVKHFSHEHDLKLIDDKFGIKEKCDACIRYIFTPYYACAQCRFFLHKSCVELRRRIRFPVLHEHTLELLPMATYATGAFGCDACGHDCNGFTYNCKECDIDLDVQCSLIPYQFTHDSHKHRLILSRAREGRRKCNNCDSNEKTQFWCAVCDKFALDSKCLTLPRMVWYGQHEHPFILCYAPEDDSDEYYCDICEEERDSRHWFYHCANCIYPAHLACILGKSPNIKSGKTYTIDNHQHPLTSVLKKTYDDGRDFMCKICVQPIENWGYQCAKCNFMVHPWRECLEELQKSKE